MPDRPPKPPTFLPIPRLFRSPPPLGGPGNKDDDAVFEVGEHNLATVEKLINRFSAAVQSALAARFDYTNADSAARVTLMAKTLCYSVTLISTANYVLKACEEMAKTFESCETIKKELVELKAQLVGMKENDEKMKFLQGTGMLENREFLVKRASLAGILQERCRNLETLVVDLQAKVREEEQAKLRGIHTTAWLQSESSSYLREKDFVLREKRILEKSHRTGKRGVHARCREETLHRKAPSLREK